MQIAMQSVEISCIDCLLLCLYTHLLFIRVSHQVTPGKFESGIMLYYSTVLKMMFYINQLVTSTLPRYAKKMNESSRSSANKCICYPSDTNRTSRSQVPEITQFFWLTKNAATTACLTNDTCETIMYKNVVVNRYKGVWNSELIRVFILSVR